MKCSKKDAKTESGVSMNTSLMLAIEDWHKATIKLNAEKKMAVIFVWKNNTLIYLILKTNHNYLQGLTLLYEL